VYTGLNLQNLPFMKKSLWLLFILIFLSACTSKEPVVVESTALNTPVSDINSEKIDLAAEFIDKAAADTQLGFSDPGPIAYSWKVVGSSAGKVKNLDSVKVNGWAIALAETNQIEIKSNIAIVDLLSNYLYDQGFEKNIYNSSAGTVIGKDAFERDKLGCMINWEIINGIDGYKTPGVPMNVILVCGEVGE